MTPVCVNFEFCIRFGRANPSPTEYQLPILHLFREGEPLPYGISITHFAFVSGGRTPSPTGYQLPILHLFREGGPLPYTGVDFTFVGRTVEDARPYEGIEFAFCILHSLREGGPLPYGISITHFAFVAGGASPSPTGYQLPILHLFREEQAPPLREVSNLPFY